MKPLHIGHIPTASTAVKVVETRMRGDTVHTFVWHAAGYAVQEVRTPIHKGPCVGGYSCKAFKMRPKT